MRKTDIRATTNLTPSHLLCSAQGCNLAGSMLVNKVGGNFHVAMGEAMVRDGRHIHQFKPQDAPGFNSSHVVHSLSFGNTYPGMGESALDGIVMVATEEEHGGTGLYQVRRRERSETRSTAQN